MDVGTGRSSAQWNAHVVSGEGIHWSAGGAFDPAEHGTYRIGGGTPRGGVETGCALHGPSRAHQRGRAAVILTIQPEHYVRRIRAEQSPAHEHACSVRNRDDAAIETLHESPL